MKAAELAAMLARDAEGVAKILLPNGKREGAEWRAGSLDGEAGKSLGVHLTGQKAGVFCDFATGEGGDLLDLWAAVRGVGIGEACNQVRDYLGVRDARVDNPKPSYSRPNRDGVKGLNHSHLLWLTDERGLSADSVRAYRLASKGVDVVFPSLVDGELVAAKYRRVPDKTFRVDANCEPVLFGWQAIPAAARSVLIVEGELDAVAAHTLGQPALSVPFGGGTGDKQAKWIAAEYDRLAPFDRIYLALDTDGPGQEATAEIVKRLGRERCYVLELPHKDINACLLAGMKTGELAELVRHAKTMDPEALRQASEFGEELISAFADKPGQERGIRLPWDKCGNDVILRAGEVSLWLGVNGHGKSQGMGQVTLGALVREFNCCVASMEFKPVNWLKRMVRQATATEQPAPAYIRHVAAWFHDKLWVFDATGTAKADQILEVFAYAARRYGVYFFLIDNLAKCGFAEDDYNGQKNFVDRLTDFAKAYGVHVALVHHMRKGESEDKPGGKLDAKGSGGITDMVDTCAVWWRNKPKEKSLKAARMKGLEPDQEIAAKPDALLLFDKQRNGECEPTYGLWFDQASLQFLGGEDHRPYRFIAFRQLEAA
ncbi:AAA family ATPase [Lysobacter panacisoli]|uniref:Toprim domain-containing protein n=1 Tax=Lysobacter panacisoli TaxID=1255263 RepID=A0ABP9LGC1_9GAMM|nr:toprim domain-containing protein [Lysobacter panacisoli]